MTDVTDKPPRKKRAASAARTAGADSATTKPARLPSISARRPRLNLVGIGASAGGLEALRQLLRQLAGHEFVAYIVAQHLSPTHRSMLVELLARETGLPVIEARDGQRPRPGTVHIVPRGCHARVEDGRIRLVKPDGRGHPKPSIDMLFSSLADDVGDHATAVVLSGTGTDGARGVRAIRAAGGLTIAQEPSSAKYDGMPRAAIDTGCVDYVLPPDAIATRLDVLTRLNIDDARGLGDGLSNPTSLERITAEVRARTGLDLALYKENTMHRRLRRRMVATEQATLEAYASYLQAHAEEAQRLAKEMLISVTSFFRDAAAFEALQQAIGEYLAARPAQTDFRAWVPGCATGEEAYSIAIVLHEVLEQLQRTCTVRVFATDIDNQALARARRGTYTATEVNDVPPTLLAKYFTVAGTHHHVVKRIRDSIIYSTQNMTRDPAFLHLDLISCRNLLIYLRPKIQESIFANFSFALNPGGLLFLGKSESVQPFHRHFPAIDERARVFWHSAAERLVPTSMAASQLPASRLRGSGGRASRPDKPSLHERLVAALQEGLLPPSALIDDSFEMKHVLGDISPFVRIAPGDVTFDLYKLALRPLRVELRSLVLKVQRDTVRSASHVVTHRGLVSPVRLTATRLPGIGAELPLTLVSFESVPEDHASTPLTDNRSGDNEREVIALEQQLVETREHLQTVIEELETSNEELQSLNEELQSANEELMSANEELETTNEELQSSNEELTTLNDELESKTFELLALTNNLQNVKNSLVYPLIVVDEHRRVMLFNPGAHELFGMLEGAVGNSVFSLPCRFDIGDLSEVLTAVLDTGVAVERQIVGRRSFMMRAEPYLDHLGARRGVVLSFVDNTAIRQAESELRDYARRLQQSQAFLQSTLDALPENICVIDARGVIVSVNRRWREFTHREGGRSDVCGLGVDYLAVVRAAAAAGDTVAASVAAGLEQVLERKLPQLTLEYPCHSPTERRWYRMTVTPIEEEDGPGCFVVSHEDISERYRQEAWQRLQTRALDESMTGIAIADARDSQLSLTYVNSAFERMTGYAAAEAIGRNCRFLQGEDREQPGLAKVRAALQGGVPVRTLLRNYRKDGTAFWNELSIYPLADADLDVAYFVGVQRDVSALIASEEALRATMEREKLALSFARVGTFEWEIRSGRMINSEMHLKLLGLSDHSRELPFPEFRACIHADDCPIFDDAVRLCVAGHDDFDLEYRVVWPDGTLHWLHTKGNVMNDAAGVPHRMLCLSQEITERKQADEQVRFIAHHDALTGLPNRTLMRDRLQQALGVAKRNRLRVALLFIDLDHFKDVNDSLGHHAGDELLQSVASRLRGCVRETDTVCRQSGDEFVVILPSIRDSNEAAHVASKVCDALSQPHRIQEHDIYAPPSIGVALYPDDGQVIDFLLRSADTAMYLAKGNGGARYEFAAHEVNARMLERVSLGNELRQGIERGELRLFYQPEIDVTSGRLLGMEALIRWAHPKRGLIAPDVFIPIAEDSDLIHTLGEWVLQEACRQNQRWLEAGLGPLTVAVNLSPLQLRSANVVEKVSKALKASGLDPCLLVLELTERAILRDVGHAQVLLRNLESLGIRLAIDDFGTGYGSLTYLHLLSFAKLKIDRSFVAGLPHDLGATAIVRALISLSLSLGIEVVAEGVEERSHLEFLRAERCSTFQGFLESEPLNAEAATAYIVSRRAAEAGHH